MAVGSSVVVAGFQSSVLLDGVRQAIENTPEAEKSAQIKSVNAAFQFNVKNDAGKVQTWTIDLKNQGTIAVGTTAAKPDIVLDCSDKVFSDLVAGKINGQRAYMTGKLKIKGNIMLALRLDNVLKAPNVKAVQAQLLAGGAPTANTASPSAAVPSSGSGSIKVDGFASSEVFNQMKTSFSTLSAADKSNLMKTKAVFQFDITNPSKKSQSFTIDLKSGNGDVYVGAAKGKADAILSLQDKDFIDIASGKLNGQKAFMAGKLKVKGQLMLATKLDTVFKEIQKKSKL